MVAESGLNSSFNRKQAQQDGFWEKKMYYRAVTGVIVVKIEEKSLSQKSILM